MQKVIIIAIRAVILTAPIAVNAADVCVSGDFDHKKTFYTKPMRITGNKSLIELFDRIKPEDRMALFQIFKRAGIFYW